ncbi:N-acetyltransferase domain-containing protein [Mycena indigotica]|uniref:N-acetyltransferase domain-containing protein n=1 Tax=Mycena indigotica TaxID=2126181 RepID=A0A8H6T0Y3_9AGAR|nr:N-acetyltransferase domain-containing protein [Mycena indigotica]KAF7307465.1 N-acetyltransferase domain-containing protein [Mycena indigotica]
MTINHQLHPLEVNPTTGEPFLRLPGYDNIVLTPPRMSDVEAMVPVFNDERVYQWLTGTPFPYTKANAEWWLGENAVPLSQRILAELEAARDEPALKMVDSCPVTIIREVLADGSEILVGGIDFTLAQRPFELDGTGWTLELLGQDPKPQRNSANPDIWTVGYYIVPSHHGRGLMSAAFKTVLEKWGVPRMGMCKMRVSALTGNEGSVKVFRKNGMVLHKTWPEDTVDVRGTRKSGVHVYEWNL